ncbi:MAG TPA: carboxypeptidase regulatory-like domain-containing protein [Vicinamibacterales bacterium]|nr:carboxypeptidase regulatory-like domain-containing protein [Vicinamibacterales bacterium]
MKHALLAMLPLLLSAPADAAQAPRAAARGASTTATITVTDLSGAPLADVRVTLTGSIDRSGSTAPNGTVKFDGLRPGTYRLRFDKEGYVLFERELEVRAKQAAPNPSVALHPAPEPPAPPPPEPPKPAPLPPPGKAITVNVPDFIERNFIANTQPQKISEVGCSGLAHTVLWQVREPWENRTHDTSDAMLYVVGGEGTVRIGAADVAVEAGSFTQIPRDTSYSISRRGRNPIIILATLVGEPCQ